MVRTGTYLPDKFGAPPLIPVEDLLLALASALDRSYFDLCTPICLMNWGNAAQEKVTFCLHEPPGWERSTTRSARLWSSGYTYGQA